MTKIDYCAAKNFASEAIAYRLHDGDVMKLARAYLNLHAEHKLLVAVAEAADNFLTENEKQCGGRVEVGEYDTLMDKFAVWWRR